MPKTLLLADDSVTIQKVVGISFASEDVKLVTVDNGDDALVRAREARPDLVLADVVMPGKNGYEVCAALKADPKLRHIPVILLTGTFEAFDEERARQVGAASHVAKPFEAQALVEEVKRVLASPPPLPDPAPGAPPRNGPDSGRPADLAQTPPASPADSFDFFDEDLGELSSEDDSWGAQPGELAEDRAFAFGDAEPAEEGEDTDAGEEPQEPRWAASPGPGQSDRTVAILTDLEPEDAPDAAIREEDLHTLGPDPDAPLLPEPDPAVEADSAAEGFEFAFDESPGGGLVDARDIARDATVDPQGVSGFDISSSDLGEGAVPVQLSPRAEVEPVVEVEALEEESLDGAEPPLAEALPLDEEEPPAPAPRAPAREASTALDAIAPELRQQLHATLEKLASESFREVAEKLVHQTVERVEKIAWEVIPHMAETLVREEIRRMKGES